MHVSALYKVQTVVLKLIPAQIPCGVNQNIAAHICCILFWKLLVYVSFRFLPLLTYPNQLNSVSQIISLLKRIFFNWYSGGWSPVGSTWHCGHQ
jgi:hypothetical protein